MIDIHTHILPKVDDGSQSLEESLELLKGAAKEGTTDLIITCHYDKEGYYHKKRAELLDRFALFREQAADIPVELYLGNELYIHRDLARDLINGTCSPLADSHYVLVEFPFESYSEDYDDILYDIKRAGYQIIIAHPERYESVQDDEDFCERWLEEGYLLQSNVSSLKHHKRTMDTLLSNKWISFMASDGHNLRRPILMKDGYDYIKRKYGPQRAQDLFVINPMRVIRNEEWKD